MTTPTAGRVLVVQGKDWSYYWPRLLWDALTPEEQQDVIAAQTALMVGLSEVRKVTNDHADQLLVRRGKHAKKTARLAV